MSDFDRLLQSDKKAERRLPWCEVAVLVVVTAFMVWRFNWYLTCVFC